MIGTITATEDMMTTESRILAFFDSGIRLSSYSLDIIAWHPAGSENRVNHRAERADMNPRVRDYSLPTFLCSRMQNG